MSAPLAHNQAPDRTAQVALLAQFGETFGPLDRAHRLHILSRRLRQPVTSTNDLTTEECRETARWLWALRQDPERRNVILQRTAAEVAPAVDPEALDAACRQDLSPAESVEQTLELLDRAAEMGHELFYALGDAALVLLAAAPGARKKDVLTEHLREKEALKPILCPDGEGDPVTQWLMLERTAARIPLETRLEFANVPFGYHKAAALALMDKGGLRVPPDLAEIERRLSAVSDNETQFRKPADLREWIAAGSKTAADGSPERVDHAAEAWLSMDTALEPLFEFIAESVEGQAVYSYIKEAFDATFGAGGHFRIVKARKR